MRKRIYAQLLVLAMLLSLFPAVAMAAESELPFQDIVPGAWYTDAVRYVYEKGMMTGMGETTFAPETPTTRGMVVTLLHRSEGTPAATGKDFLDVAAGQWYTAAVAWASANDIVNGYGDGTFRPNDNITREQFATILFRYAGFKGLDVSGRADLTVFTDAETVSGYAKEPMAWAVKEGLISGMTSELLSPATSATRAQAATMLMRYQTKTAAQEPAPSATPTPTPSATPSNKPSSGGGGGGGGGSLTPTPTPTPAPTKTLITAVAITVDDAPVASGAKVKAGDTLAVAVTPEAATYDVSWTAGGAAVAGDTYVVTVADTGKTVTAKVTGKGEFGGEKTATVAVEDAKTFALSEESIPRVAVAEDATYYTVAEDGTTTEVTLSESSVLSLNITDKSSEDTNVETEIGIGEGEEAKKSSLLRVIEKAAGAGEDSLAADTAIPEDAVFASVAVELTLTTTVEEEGAEPITTTETVHPVGDTVVLLTAADLGVIDPDADLNDYVLFAQHTNANGETELQPGVAVTVEGKQYGQFKLSGLSRIWIGNVPPRTVTFYADETATAPLDTQVVKFGGYAKYVEPPKKDGFIFTGWDHDIRTENILQDTRITALWVEGKTAGDAQLTGAWSPATPEDTELTPVRETTGQGTRTITLDSKADYTANLSYSLTMAPPDNLTTVAKFATATTAEGALASTDYTDVTAPGSALTITKSATNAGGKAQVSTTNLYVKWVDAEGKPLLLQSMTLVIRTENLVAGNYDTQTRTEIISVNRGIGRPSYYLTGGSKTVGTGEDAQTIALPDYEGTVNGYLNTRTVNGVREYYLRAYPSFGSNFSLWALDDTNTYSGSYGRKDYTGYKVVIAPFEGESFTALPTVSTRYYDADHQEVKDALDVRVIKDDRGNLVLTCDMPTPVESKTRAYDDEVDFTLTLNGKTMEFEMPWNISAPYSSRKRLTTERWEDVMDFLGANEAADVTYTGEDVTLTGALTLKPTQSLTITFASLTIGSGGTLTLNGDSEAGADIYINEGSLTVADGGILATNSQNGQGTRAYTYVRLWDNDETGAGTLSVERGGKIVVPTDGLLVLNAANGIKVKEGGSVTCEGKLELSLNFDSGEGIPPVEIAGTVTISAADDASRWAYVDVNEGLVITETGKVDLQGRGYLYAYKGPVNKGSITAKGAANVRFSGPAINEGTITVENVMYMYNDGYSICNKGTILLNGGRLYVDGTVLVNTGTISGSGQVYARELDAAESDYDNGIEYVEGETDSSKRTPANYSHYKFVRDPAAEVETTIFIGEVDNQADGTCTAKINK